MSVPRMDGPIAWRVLTYCHSAAAVPRTLSINTECLSAPYFRKIKQAYGKRVPQGRGVCVCVYWNLSMYSNQLDEWNQVCVCVCVCVYVCVSGKVSVCLHFCTCSFPVSPSVWSSSGVFLRASQSHANMCGTSLPLSFSLSISLYLSISLSIHLSHVLSSPPLFYLPSSLSLMFSFSRWPLVTQFKLRKVFWMFNIIHENKDTDSVHERFFLQQLSCKCSYAKNVFCVAHLYCFCTATLWCTDGCI